jgi:hypothetical protein
MGRQIEFFQSIEDEQEFLNVILSLGYKIADNEGNKLTIDDVITSSILSLYIYINDFSIVKRNGYIEQIESEVIQYSIGAKNDKDLHNSRLWMQQNFFNSNGQITYKSEAFTDMFNILSKSIKKQYTLSNCNHFYIGRIAYKLYIEKGISMWAGPNHLVRFI